MQSLTYRAAGRTLLLTILSTGPSPLAAPPSPPPSFAALLARPLDLRPERQHQHPRLFFGPPELRRIRDIAAQRPAAWRAYVDEAAALRTPPPPATAAQDRGLMYQVGLALPEPAFAYAVTREPRLLTQARAWIAAVLSYEPWGYTYDKPDQDIPAAHLLYGLATTYDLLYDDLPPVERDRIRLTLTTKARRLYEAYTPGPKKRYSYSQNHTFINAAAIGLAAIALDAETDETKRWLAFARAVFDRTIDTYSRDGYYYEGYHYFEFSVPWIVHMLDALEYNGTERLYDRIRLDLTKDYVAHSLLPGGQFFDFGDAGRGAADRLAGASDLLGAQGILYRLAERYRDPDARAVADWASASVKRSREPMWDFIWRESGQDAPPRSLDRIPLVHHFKDADVVFARTSWDDRATAVAVKCGPPEGHRAAPLIALIPDWRQSTGHAHPDAGSFIVFSRGAYLTGDAGYTGVKMTSDHNTLLIDGRGQSNDGRHEVFRDVPAERLDGIRITEARASAGGVRVVCDGTAAYDPSLGLVRWQRTFVFDDRGVEIADSVETKAARAATVLLHSDRTILPWDGPQRDEASASRDRFALTMPQGRVMVGIEPSNLDARLEPQIVTTQGRPGSVEKGEREQRGYVLSVTTRPATRTDIRMRLDIVHATSPAPSAVEGQSPEKP